MYFWNFPFHIFRPGLSLESETADKRGPTVRARSQETVSELEIQKRWVSKAYGEVGTEATEERRYSKREKVRGGPGVDLEKLQKEWELAKKRPMR